MAAVSRSRRRPPGSQAFGDALWLLYQTIMTVPVLSPCRRSPITPRRSW